MKSAALWPYDLELWATRSKYGYSHWLFAQGGENEPLQVFPGTRPEEAALSDSRMHGCARISSSVLLNTICKTVKNQDSSRCIV